MFLRD